MDSISLDSTPLDIPFDIIDDKRRSAPFKSIMLPCESCGHYRQQAHDELYGHTVDVDASPSECLNQPKKFRTSKLHLNDLNEKISNPKSMRNLFRLSEFQSIQSAFSSAATVDIEQI